MKAKLKKSFLISCTVMALNGIFQSIAIADDSTRLSTSTTPPVDASESGAPNKRLRPFGQQIANWQKQQLEQEKMWREKMNAEHRMMAVKTEKGTVENVHPYMSTQSPRLNFDK